MSKVLNLWFLVFWCSVAVCVAQNDTTTTTSTRKPRYSRRTTTVAPLISELVELETIQPVTSIEPVTIIEPKITLADMEPPIVNISDATIVIDDKLVPKPVISVEVSTKTMRVKNCGERIGDDVPFIVILVHTNPNDKKKKKRTLSKGVLISEKFVLTTVSSIYHGHAFWAVTSVRLGDFVTWNKYANRDKSNVVEVGIEQVFYHTNKDIALIKLKEEVQFTEVIRAACLPLSDSYTFSQLSTHMCKKTVRSHNPTEVSLQHASPLSTYDCNKIFQRRGMQITPQQFCVWDESGDNCAGDIATPVFTISNGRFIVVGLNSHIDTEDDFDTTDYPGIYVKIGSHLDWIHSIMKFNST